MGLETATFISGLTASWPPSGDPKNQGDDHLRLLKSVLQSTFPNAAGPWYLPKTETTTLTLTLDVTDQNNVVMVTTTGGDVSVVLPTGFTTANAGWSCEVVKTSSDTNAAVVTPASGTISSKVGNTASIRVGALNEPARFLWTGSTWICVKPGPMVGSTLNWDGPTVPYGCMVLDGSAYNTTTFAELFAAFGSATLRDKRGRVEAGVDSGAGRLSASYFGVSPVNGAVGGGESTALTLAQLAAHTHANVLNFNDPGHTHTDQRAAGWYTSSVGGNLAGGSGAGTLTTLLSTNGTGITCSITNVAAGSGAGHSNVQHTIVTNKIVRAC